MIRQSIECAVKRKIKYAIAYVNRREHEANYVATETDNAETAQSQISPDLLAR